MTDPAFEALAEVCGIEWRKDPETSRDRITADERGRVNAALKQLRAIYSDDLALPMMIHERAAAYRQVYPEMPLTPQALTGNWSTVLDAAVLVQARERDKRTEQRRVTNAHSTRPCDTCHGDRMMIIAIDLNGNETATPCWECNGGRMPIGWRPA